jgi:hypothetical protein
MCENRGKRGVSRRGVQREEVHMRGTGCIVQKLVPDATSSYISSEPPALAKKI